LEKEPADCRNCSEQKSRYSEWACAHCPEFRLDQVSSATWHLLEIRRLKAVGFSLAPEDLDYVSWHLLASLEEKIELKRRQRETRYGGLF
jgi:hypothetical protein